jgi:hypothetical protein
MSLIFIPFASFITFVCIGHRDNVWPRLDSIFPLLGCQGVRNKTYNFPFPKSSFRIQRTTSWGCLKILLSFFMRFDGHFWPNQQQLQCLPQFESILDSHLLPAPFHLKIENTILKLLIGSDPHSHKPFAPILVFLSQIDWLWNKNFWQLSVHSRHPWRIKKTDFTWQVISRTLSEINKQNSVCERMLVNST